MALADTAKLLASLELKDNFTPASKKAEASLGRLEQKFGKIGGIASKGFRTIGSNLKSLVTGPAGLIAGGAAVFALTNFISDSVGKAREFGETVFKVKGIIGGTTQQVSQLVDVLGDYGITSDKVVTIGALFEKNLGTLAKSQKAAAKFQKDYGIGLVDNTGKARDFNAVLLDAADLFTSKTIPQSTKAAALAKLYGRNWKELIPILSLGRTELEKTLGKGITLTDAQAKSLEKARKAGIKWEDALGDLQTMIGIELLPVITKFVSKLTTFVQTHGEEIRAFFRDAAKFAMGMAQAIKRDVLPAISAIGDIWAGVPDDLKKLLIGGFVVNKLSGGAVTGIVSELAKGLIKGVLGITAGVVNINAGVVNGGGGVPAVPGGKGGGGVIAGAVKATIIGAAGVAIAETALAVSGINDVSHVIDGHIARGTNVLEARIANVRDNIQHLEERAAAGDEYAARQLVAQRALLARLTNGQQSAATRIASATQTAGSRTLSALHANTQSTARNLDQVTGAIRAKKLSVKVSMSQAQRQAINASISGTGPIGRKGFHYTSSEGHKLDVSRVLAKGAVGVASQATPAIFGEAGPEAFAILRNPRKGMLGGGVPIVHVHVNIDPRRITRKQTSSGVYKTYVAT